MSGESPSVEAVQRKKKRRAERREEVRRRENNHGRGRLSAEGEAGSSATADASLSEMKKSEAEAKRQEVSPEKSKKRSRDGQGEAQPDPVDAENGKKKKPGKGEPGYAEYKERKARKKARRKEREVRQERQIQAKTESAENAGLALNDDEVQSGLEEDAVAEPVRKPVKRKKDKGSDARQVNAKVDAENTARATEGSEIADTDVIRTGANTASNKDANALEASASQANAVEQAPDADQAVTRRKRSKASQAPLPRAKRSRVQSMITASQSQPSLALSSTEATRQDQESTAQKQKRPRKTKEAGEGKASIGNKKTSIDALLNDCAGLTNDEVLIYRSYDWNQLRMLAQARSLTYKTGHFSAWEHAKVHEILSDFDCEEGYTTTKGGEVHSEELAKFVCRKQTGGEQQKYQDLFQRLARALPGRPYRAIRMFAMRLVVPNARRGPWTVKEQLLLEQAVQEFGKEWAKVAERVKRSSEDCRVRWRDYGNREDIRTGAWSDEENEVFLNVMKSTSSDGPALWKAVCEALDNKRTRAQCKAHWRILTHMVKNGDEVESTPEASIRIGRADKGERGAQPDSERDRQWSGAEEMEFVDRLSQQQRAMERDDFTEVDSASFIQNQGPWARKYMVRRWRSLVDVYIRRIVRARRTKQTPNQTNAESDDEDWDSFDYALNFRDNINKIKEGVALRMQAEEARGKRLTAAELQSILQGDAPAVDLIESDEES